MLRLPRLVLKHTPVPIFSGKKPDLAPWTNCARHYAKIVGFVYVFVSDLPHYISVGDLDTENALLTDMGYSRLKCIYTHALASTFLSTALESKSDKSILDGCSSPREAWDALLAWYGPQTTGAESDLSRRFNSFIISPGSNLLEEKGRIEDVDTEMRTTGLTFDDHVLYTIVIDALPA